MSKKPMTRLFSLIAFMAVVFFGLGLVGPSETNTIAGEPLGEICDDGKDNDGDKLVDCEDSDCDCGKPIRLIIRIACPNDSAAAGVQVCIAGVGCAETDALGIATIDVPSLDTYTVCVTESTLPTGATLAAPCKNVKVESDAPPVVDFALGGDFCKTPPPPGDDCWLTGGGTVDKSKGQPNYSFGGVVYPGCSPKAADGGNWNVVDHFTGLHFQGQHIVVVQCSGVSTESPRVTVNIIDFHGDGIIAGIGGNPDAKVPVTFVGRAVDVQEGGHDKDMLFISVSDGSGVLLQIGNSALDPAIITTGNLQIHQSSCNN